MQQTENSPLDYEFQFLELSQCHSNFSKTAVQYLTFNLHECIHELQVLYIIVFHCVSMCVCVCVSVFLLHIKHSEFCQTDLQLQEL